MPAMQENKLDEKEKLLKKLKRDAELKHKWTESVKTKN